MVATDLDGLWRRCDRGSNKRIRSTFYGGCVQRKLLKFVGSCRPEAPPVYFDLSMEIILQAINDDLEPAMWILHSCKAIYGV